MKTPILIVALIVIVAAVAVGAVLILGSRMEPTVQPMRFNHKRHLQENMACKDCHREVEKGAHATLPTLKTCLLCHKEAKGENPEEPKIREYAKDGREIPWQQVNRLPGHVYFSHAAHVKYGKMDCRECHGETAEQTEPVTMPQINHLTMNKCMECHEEKKVSNDCLVCHK